MRRFTPPWEFFLFLIGGLLLLEPIFSMAGVVDKEALDLDPVVGWSLMPGKTYTFREEGYSISKINSLGMRDRERTLAKPEGTFRIAVVGCSVTEGNQVPIERTYCGVLERLLNDGHSDRKYEVLNFGTSAYTLGQEYLKLKHTVLRFSPDVVLFTARPNSLLFMGPDQRLGFYNARPIFGVTPDGKLIEDRHYQKLWLQSAAGRRIAATRWLRYNSRLWGVVGKASACVADFQRNSTKFIRQVTTQKFGRTGDSQTVRTAPTPDEARKRLETLYNFFGPIAAAIIREAKSDCDRANCRFVLVYLPAAKVQRDECEGRVFRGIADKQELNFVDLNPDMDAREKRNDRKLYCVVHPSIDGHLTIAESLKSYLLRHDLLEKPESEPRRETMVPQALSTAKNQLVAPCHVPYTPEGASHASTQQNR